MIRKDDPDASMPSADEVEEALQAFHEGSPDELDRLLGEDETGDLGICDLLSKFTNLAPEQPSLPERIGDYTIIREIGRGGMGVVYEAKQERTGRTVALKVIRQGWLADAAQVKLFRREVDTLARLKHPYIATLYDAGNTPEGHHYFAMELAAGETLAKHLIEGQVGGDAKLGDNRERLRSFGKICRAMNYAHQRGVIHRDLKPANIFVDDQGEPKILDFGLARLLDAEPQAMSSIADSGKIVGTLHYMSPEQARGQIHEIDIRSDVYTLGIILYEMLTGKRPYTVHSAALPEAVHNICEVPPRRPSAVSPTLRGDLETIILKALEKEPDRRYQSAAALANDIDRFLSNQPILARSPSALYQLQKMVSRHKLPAALMAAMFVLVAASAIVVGIQAAKIADERDKVRAEAHRAQRVSEYLHRMVASANPREADFSLSVREILDRAGAGINTELTGEPEIQASLHDTIGRGYEAIWILDRAEEHLREALELRRAVHGERHPLVAKSLHSLGRVLERRGDREGGHKLLRDAYELRRALLGDEHIDIAESLHYLPVLLQAGDWEQKMEQQHRAALAIRRRLLGEHRDVAESLDILGTFLVRAGRYDEAESLLTESVEMRRRILGPDHFEVAGPLNFLGEIHWHRAEYDKAEGLFREQIRILRGIFSGDSHDLALALSDLAVILEYKGKLEESEKLHRESVTMQRSVVGDDSGDLALNLNNFASFLRNQGRYLEAEPLCRDVYRLWASEPAHRSSGMAYASANLASALMELESHDEAERLFREAIQIWRKHFGVQNPVIAKPLTGLGRLMVIRGAYDEGERFIEEGLNIRRDRLGKDNPQTAMSQVYLARVRHERGTPGAVAMYSEALRVLCDTKGDRHADVARATGQLAAFKKDEGDPAAAEKLYREAITMERQLPREKHPVLAECLAGLAEVLLTRGEPASAEPLLLEALDIQQQRFIKSDRRTARTQSTLGACLTALDRYDDAEPLLLDSHATLVSRCGSEHRDTLLTKQRVLALYASWGKPGKAAEWE